MHDQPTPLCATPEQWRFAAYHVGVDLLPAVGDPDIPLNERMQRIGSAAKVPSMIGGNGVAHGLQKWTAYQATPQLVKDWSSEPAYNILIQTRNIRGIDIDVEDQAFADQLEAFIVATLGVVLPVRYRLDSPRRTLFLRLDPITYIGKRIIHVELPNGTKGAIEGLFNGCQSLWAGRHPSGAIMQHRNHENGFPVVSQAAFAALWDTLRNTYDPRAKPLILLDEQQGDLIVRNSGTLKNDPVLAYLEEEGFVVGYEANGTANVRCPNEHEHTSESENSTSWLPAGLGGRDVGGFRCLHAHCEHIKTPQFLEMVGYRDKEIATNFGGDTLEQHPSIAIEQRIADTPAAADMCTLSNLAAKNGVALVKAGDFVRTPKGELKKGLTNLLKVVSTPSIVNARYDSFRNEVLVQLGGVGAFHRLTDNIVSRVRIIVENTLGHTYSYDEVSRQIELAAEENAFDSAIEWLEQLTWDGVSRIDTFATDILKAKPSEYGVAFSRYLFTALAGRVLSPGCKADIAPVLVSPKQGTGKSSMISKLAPFYDWFGTVDLTHADDDVYRSLKGKVVVELPELRGLHGRDAAATKALLSQQVDQYVPKYRERAVELPRRCLLIGSDNRRRFLVDSSGNRRWAPIHVAVTAQFIDWPAFELEREQYWAEAVHLLRKFSTVEFGVETFSTELRKLGADAVLDATILDAWHSAVELFIYQQPAGTKVTLQAIAAHMFGGGIGALDQHRTYRLRNIMTMLRLEDVGHDTWLVNAPEYIL